MEYTLKTYNKEQAAAVSALPSSKRWQYSDVKEKFTELTLKEYVDITNSLASQMKGTLNKTLDIKGAEAAIEARVLNDEATFYIHPETGDKTIINEAKNEMLTAPKVPSCFAEDLVGHSIMSFQSRIDKVNTKLLENSNYYLRDAAKEMTNMSLPSGKKASITPESFERVSI